ncbi:MAG: hypothetical protein KatS3mg026_0083 [Bacteroidia bacterium]|nr:MAG: hypothetical protein KatS3mg026_0083 [Bacteroidia bacterium]
MTWPRLLLLGSLIGHLLLHVRHFELDLFGFHAWRQCQTVATAVSFYEEDFRLWNPRRDCRGSGEGLFRMEFPLFQWGLAAAAKLTKRHPSSLARAGTYLCFLLSVAGMFLFLSTLLPQEGAWLGTAAYLWSPALFYYSVTPLPDMTALAAALWGLGLWRKHQPLAASLCLSLATAIKIPFVLLWAFPLLEAQLDFLRTRKVVVYGALSMVLPSLWYAHSEIWKNEGLIKGLGAHPFSWASYLHLVYHHLLSLLPENLIGYASVGPFLIGSYALLQERDTRRLFLGTGFVLLAYLLYELPTLGYPHDYYLFPWFPWTGWAIAIGLTKLWKSPKRVWVFLFLLAAPVGAWARMHHRWNPEKPGFNPDLLICKTHLQNAVPDTSRVVVGLDKSGFIYLYHLHKKGWCLSSLEDSCLLEQAVLQGGEYLYSDSRALDSLARPYLREKVKECGSFRVYRLATHSESMAP